ncbi:type II secretion system protein [Neptunomonas japonica]|uniref:type II secretion system protein n=1 Tax=Neptunomonas japonica TaxID=417574 RepID=UPI000401B489|nr:prepilin-type N-terminal cleavage/methylation domain-containing protein [Neptunomonas japonica]
MFSNIKALELVKKFSTVEVNDIQDAKLRKQARKLKSKQGGFTLLELLVVVAILAAIAGTATIALQDTDARASAAAHVAMMDELNKGIRTFRVLNGNTLPNNFDSLLTTTTADIATFGTAATLLPNADDQILAITDVTAGSLINGAAEVMDAIGMTNLRYVISDPATLPDDVAAGGCDPAGLITAGQSLQASVASRSNAMVAGNIFNGATGNGCGDSVTMDDTSVVAYWSGSVERLLGPGEYGEATFDGAAMQNQTADSVAPILLAVGMGPASNLFNANSLGGMTSVPVYRHVSGDQYNRFIGLFQVGQSTDVGGTATITATDQISFAGVVDGAGDTKEEELGEWDGTRNTI